MANRILHGPRLFYGEFQIPYATLEYQDTKIATWAPQSDAAISQNATSTLRSKIIY